MNNIKNIQKDNKKEEADQEMNPNGVEDMLHVITIIITAVCSLLMILLINGILYNAAGSGALQWVGLKSFLEGYWGQNHISQKVTLYIAP